MNCGAAVKVYRGDESAIIPSQTVHNLSSKIPLSNKSKGTCFNQLVVNRRCWFLGVAVISTCWFIWGVLRHWLAFIKVFQECVGALSRGEDGLRTRKSPNLNANLSNLVLPSLISLDLINSSFVQMLTICVYISRKVIMKETFSMYTANKIN